MPHDDDIFVKGLQGVLGPPRRHVHCLSDLWTEQALDGVDVGKVSIYLLVDNDVHFDTLLSPALEDAVKAVLLIKFAWPPEIQLRRKPPVLGVGS